MLDNYSVTVLQTTVPRRKIRRDSQRDREREGEKKSICHRGRLWLGSGMGQQEGNWGNFLMRNEHW